MGKKAQVGAGILLIGWPLWGHLLKALRILEGAHFIVEGFLMGWGVWEGVKRGSKGVKRKTLTFCSI